MQKHKKYGHVGVSGSGLPKAGESTACTAASTSTKGATKPAAKAAAAKPATAKPATAKPAATSVAKRAAKRATPATPATPKVAKAAKPSPSPSPSVASAATAVAVAPAKPAVGKSVAGKSATAKPTRKSTPAPPAAAPPAAAPPAALLERHRKSATAGSKLDLRIQRLVAKGEAEIEPKGAELSAEALVVDGLVWGEYRGDKVWYPGQVVRRDCQLLVQFDDGETDHQLTERRWRSRR